NVLNDANPEEELLGNLSEANGNPARDANVHRNEDPLVNPDQWNNLQQDDPNPQTLQLLQVIAIALAGQRGPRLKYNDVFAAELDQLGRTSIVQHEIHTEEGPPIKRGSILCRGLSTNSLGK
ncbi:10072_t:CDS:2, partial [Gigaspora rosea]